MSKRKPNTKFTKQEADFNFFVPASFEKGKGDELPDVLWIEGDASAKVEDVDGETLEPIGFDYAPFLEKGLLNYNHQQNKTASAIIGEPTEAKIKDNGNIFWIRGFLYRDDPEAIAVYKKARSLERNSPTRRFGFSIEGQATERDPLNPKRIIKARITGCAITASPKNPNTLMSIVKGEYEKPFVDEEEEDEEVKKATTCPKCDHDQMIEGKCLECGYVEKAMDMAATGMLSVESIEGVKNTNARQAGTKVAVALKKSEIYNRILNDYSTDPVIVKSIYNYIISANKKINNMTSGEQITPDVLEKALAFLNDSIVKSEDSEPQGKEPKEDEKKPAGEPAVKEDAETEEQRFDKACQMAKGFLAEGMNKGQAMDEMVKAGLPASTADAACMRCIAEANSAKEGGAVTTLSPAGFDKSITDAMALLFAPQNELIKSINTNMDNKFQAVGTVLSKALGDNEILKKSLSELTTRLVTVENTPIPGKSATNVASVERFAKSEEGGGFDVNTYSISKSDDRRSLINLLGAHAETFRTAGRQNFTLEKAISNLEIAQSLGGPRDLQEIGPLFKSFGIKVTA